MANASALNWKSVQSSLKFQSFFPPLSEEIRRESFSSQVPDQAYMWNVCIIYTSHNENIYLKNRTERRGSDELNFLRCCMTCFPTAVLRLNIRAAGHIHTNQKTPISDVLQHRFKTSQSRLISNFILQAPSSPPSADRAEPLVFLCVALHP